MRYIMDGKAWQALKNAPPGEQMKLFNAFWQARQPGLRQEENQLLAEFYLRVEETMSRFTWAGVEGWKTDRGRTWIVFGEPDGIQREQRSNSEYEIWTYNESGQQFVFVNSNNTEDFRLISSGV